jgi:hypothetical protein
VERNREFHEDVVLGEDKELMRWLYSNPGHKKKLEEFLAFADAAEHASVQSMRPCRAALVFIAVTALARFFGLSYRN